MWRRYFNLFMLITMLIVVVVLPIVLINHWLNPMLAFSLFFSLIMVFCWRIRQQSAVVELPNSLLCLDDAHPFGYWLRLSDVHSWICRRQQIFITFKDGRAMSTKRALRHFLPLEKCIKKASQFN